jgi:hypothetical protein
MAKFEKEGDILKRPDVSTSITPKGGKPKDFSKTTYSKSKKTKKLLDASPDLDDIYDIQDLIHNI